jgi:hypothetical protein
MKLTLGDVTDLLTWHSVDKVAQINKEQKLAK